jgi:4-hydroxy-tetrahydrodipicolinate synthase
VLAAAATPFAADFSIVREEFVRHCRWLLAQGCQGIVLFGSTGESASLTAAERRELLEALLAAGLPADRLIIGTGCAALGDTLALTRHALASGCRRALVHPPFFFKGVSDAGLEAYYRALLDTLGDTRLQLYLYHFPQTVGAGISAALANRLRERYPAQVVGYKDSSGDWANTLNIRSECPALDLYAGTEARFLELKRAGGTGCISASANVHPAAIAALDRAGDSPAADELQKGVAATRQALEKLPLIPAVKALLQRIHGHDSWGRLRPPLMALAESQLAALKDILP